MVHSNDRLVRVRVSSFKLGLLIMNGGIRRTVPYRMFVLCMCRIRSQLRGIIESPLHASANQTRTETRTKQTQAWTPESLD